MYTIRHERVSDDVQRIHDAVCDGRAVPGLSVSIEMARKVRLPEVRRGGWGLVCRQHIIHMQELQASSLRNSGNDFPRHKETSEGMVHRYLVGNDPEKWGERDGFAAGSWVEKLYDRMDMAAKNPQGDGVSEPKQTVRNR